MPARSACRQGSLVCAPETGSARIMNRLRLGTRGSLLATAQSRLIAAALKRLHPDITVELLAVSTRGDRNQDVPLQDVRDPDF